MTDQTFPPPSFNLHFSSNTSSPDAEQTTCEYYQLLGVSKHSSQEDIRQAYYNLSKKLHPDKSKSTENLEQLSAIQCAYQALSDTTKRTLYDIRNGFYMGADKQKKLRKLEKLQRKKAQSATELLGTKYKKIRDREVAKNGVVIVKSLYGNLRLKQKFIDDNYTGNITDDHLEGPFVEVHIPLQCQVDRSRLIIPGGPSTSKADIEGLYNPAATMDTLDLCLYVLYSFQGHLHEVTVTEKAELAIPLKAHRLNALPRGPFAPCNLSSSRHTRLPDPDVPTDHQGPCKTKVAYDLGSETPCRIIGSFGGDYPETTYWDEPETYRDLPEARGEGAAIRPGRILSARSRFRALAYSAMFGGFGWVSAYIYLNRYDKDGCIRYLRKLLEESVPFHVELFRAIMEDKVIDPTRPFLLQMSDFVYRLHSSLCTSFQPYAEHMWHQVGPPLHRYIFSFQLIDSMYFIMESQVYSIAKICRSNIDILLTHLPQSYTLPSVFLSLANAGLPPTPSPESCAYWNNIIGTPVFKIAMRELRRRAPDGPNPVTFFKWFHKTLEGRVNSSAGFVPDTSPKSAISTNS